MAPRTHEPLLVQPAVEVRVRHQRVAERSHRVLLGEGRVAGQAQPGRRRIRPLHLGQLATDPRPHAARVQAGLPVGELHGVAGPAARRIQGPLKGLKCKGAGP